MAMVPDAAILAASEISSTAFRLYAYYCMKRNRTQKGWNCPQQAVLSSGLSRDQYFRGKKELLEKGWIAAHKDFITPVRGFEEEVRDESEHYQNRKNATPESSEKLQKSKYRSQKPNCLLEKSDSYKRNTSTLNQPNKQESLTPAEEVFEYWVATLKKRTGTKFGPKRRKAVEARLKDGYTVDDLKKAIRGCSITPHNMGVNDSGTVYDELELICRDETKVDRFVTNWETYETQGATTVVSSGDAAFCDACRSHNGRTLMEQDGQFVSVRCDHGQTTESAKPDVDSGSPDYEANRGHLTEHLLFKNYEFVT
jgi:hypothetical protein